LGEKVTVPRNPGELDALYAGLAPGVYTKVLLGYMDAALSMAGDPNPGGPGSSSGTSEGSLVGIENSEAFASSMRQLRSRLKVGPMAFVDMYANRFILGSAREPLGVTDVMMTRAGLAANVDGASSYWQKSHVWELFEQSASDTNFYQTRTLQYNAGETTEAYYVGGAEAAISDLQTAVAGTLGAAEAPVAGVPSARRLLAVFEELARWDLLTSLFKLAKRDFSDPEMLGFLATGDLRRKPLSAYSEALYIWAHFASHTYAPLLALWRVLDVIYDIPEWLEAERRQISPADFDRFRSYALALRQLPLPGALAQAVEYINPMAGEFRVTPLHSWVVEPLFTSSVADSSERRARSFAELGLTTYSSAGLPRAFLGAAGVRADFTASYYKLTADLHELLCVHGQVGLDIGSLYTKGAGLFGFRQAASGRGGYVTDLVVDATSFAGSATSSTDALISDPVPAASTRSPLALCVKRSDSTAVDGSGQTLKALIPEGFTYFVPRPINRDAMTRTLSKYGGDLLEFRGVPGESDVVGRSFVESKRCHFFDNTTKGWLAETGMVEAEWVSWLRSLRNLNQPWLNSILDTFLSDLTVRDDVPFVLRGPDVVEWNTSVGFAAVGDSPCRFTTAAGVTHEISFGNVFQLHSGRLFSEFDPRAHVFVITGEPTATQKLFSSLT